MFKVDLKAPWMWVVVALLVWYFFIHHKSQVVLKAEDK